MKGDDRIVGPLVLIILVSIVVVVAIELVRWLR